MGVEIDVEKKIASLLNTIRTLRTAIESGKYILAGQPGPTGPKGLQGPTGPMGETGLTGETGLRGAQGKDGVPGPQGPNGPKGPPGKKGPTGKQGQKGATGAQGSTGPKGPRGPTGPTGKTIDKLCGENGKKQSPKPENSDISMSLGSASATGVSFATTGVSVSATGTKYSFTGVSISNFGGSISISAWNFLAAGAKNSMATAVASVAGLVTRAFASANEFFPSKVENSGVDSQFEVNDNISDGMLLEN